MLGKRFGLDQFQFELQYPNSKALLRCEDAEEGVFLFTLDPDEGRQDWAQRCRDTEWEYCGASQRVLTQLMKATRMVDEWIAGVLDGEPPIEPTVSGVEWTTSDHAHWIQTSLGNLSIPDSSALRNAYETLVREFDARQKIWKTCW